MANREKLIELAVWLGGEKAKLDLGLPSEWNQTSWFNTDNVEANGTARFGCGTACCAAGRTALRAGGLPAYTVYNGEIKTWKRWDELSEIERKTASSDDGIIDEDNRYVYVTLSDNTMYFPQPDGTFTSEHVREVARIELGLTDDQASSLFAGNNTYEDMIFWINDILEEDRKRTEEVVES